MSILKLKPQDRQSIDFAETERQKSKNLWDCGDVSGTTAVSIALKQPLPAGTYTLSAVANSMDTDNSYCLIEVYDENNSWITGKPFKREQRAGVTITSAIPIHYVKFYAATTYNAGIDDTFSFTDIMITTDGSTDYQPYNDAITHNGDAPVVFAESERQKSKNLAKIKNGTTTIKGVEITATDGTVTCKGTSSGVMTVSFLGNDGVKYAGLYYESVQISEGNSIHLKAGTYTISSATNTFFVLLYGDLGTMISSGATILQILNTNLPHTITFDKDTYLCILRYLDSNITWDLTYGEIQIESGDTKTSFSPYNGAIVHENDIADVEHIETIYDMKSTTFQIVNDVAYTAGIPIDLDNIVAIPIRMTGVKKIIVWIQATKHSSNWFSDGVKPLIINTTQTGITGDAQYRGNMTMYPYFMSHPGNANADSIFSFCGTISQSSGTQNLTIRGIERAFKSDTKLAISTTNSNVNDHIRITKVEVVK